MTVSNLIEAARTLSREDRAILTDALKEMDAPHGLDLTPAQQSDLDRRIDEYRSGKTKMIDGDEAFAQLRRRV